MYMEVKTKENGMPQPNPEQSGRSWEAVWSDSPWICVLGREPAP